MSAVSVGIIGLGTVGSGVAKILLERRAEIAQRTGVDLALVAAADVKPERAAALNLSRDIFTPDANALLARRDIDIVVELIGGLEPARSFITQALAHGQSVVTANKHLLAESFHELTNVTASGGSALFLKRRWPVVFPCSNRFARAWPPIVSSPFWASSMEPAILSSAR